MVELTCKTPTTTKIPFNVANFTTGPPAEIEALIGSRPKELRR
jgi:hypothetical protein